MAIAWDENAPADSASIPAYPANARAHRAAVKAGFGVEHDTVDGRHAFEIGNQAAQDALTGYVDGTPFFLITSGGKLQARVRYAALGGWLDVIPPTNYAARDAAGDWELYQYSTPVTVTPGAGSPNTIAVSSGTSPAKKTTLVADSILSNPAGAFAAGVFSVITMEVTQDGTGGHTLTFDTSYVFVGGVAPLISSAAGSVSLLSLAKLSNNSWAVTCAPGLS